MAAFRNKKDKCIITRHLTADHIKEIKSKFIVASIDPGSVNLAIRIEERRKNKHPKFLLFCKWDIRENKPLKSEVEGVVDSKCSFLKLTQNLENYKDILLKCDIVIVERQLSINYKATRIMQHIITYFQMLLIGTGSVIYEVDPKLKSKILQAPKKVDLKAWSVDVAKQMLEERKDDHSLEIIDYYSKKQDDLCDVVIQTESTLRYLGLSQSNL